MFWIGCKLELDLFSTRISRLSILAVIYTAEGAGYTSVKVNQTIHDAPFFIHRNQTALIKKYGDFDKWLSCSDFSRKLNANNTNALGTPLSSLDALTS